MLKSISLLVKAAGHGSGEVAVADCTKHPTSLGPSRVQTPATHLNSRSLRFVRMSQDYMGRLEDEAAAVGEQHQIGPRDGVEVQAVSIQVARSLVDWSRTWSLMAVVSSLSCVETRRENLPIAGDSK